MHLAAISPCISRRELRASARLGGRSEVVRLDLATQVPRGAREEEDVHLLGLGAGFGLGLGFRIGVRVGVRVGARARARGRGRGRARGRVEDAGVHRGEGVVDGCDDQAIAREDGTR